MSCGRKIGPYPCCSVVEGDCLELMKALPDGCVDAVITDPPYGVSIADWDDMNPREFARFTMRWLSDAARVGREVVAFGVADSCVKPLLGFIYPRVRTLIWDKLFVCGGAAERGFFFAYESVFHGYTPDPPQTFTEPKELIVGALIKEARTRAGLSRSGVDILVRGKKTGLCFRWEEGACLPTQEQAKILCRQLSMNGEFTDALTAAYLSRNETVARARAGAAERAAELHDVFRYTTVSNTDHPCKKPVELMADVIGLVPPSAVIFDPFTGSGTTLVAAAKLGRHFLGFEISPEYCAIARKRIALVEAQPNLFQPKAEQLNLGEGTHATSE
jgi:hypothetical protein